jgi:hypothetical protein
VARETVAVGAEGVGLQYVAASLDEALVHRENHVGPRQVQLLEADRVQISLFIQRATHGAVEDQATRTQRRKESLGTRHSML